MKIEILTFCKIWRIKKSGYVWENKVTISMSSVKLTRFFLYYQNKNTSVWLLYSDQLLKMDYVLILFAVLPTCPFNIYKFRYRRENNQKKRQFVILFLKNLVYHNKIGTSETWLVRQIDRRNNERKSRKIT